MRWMCCKHYKKGDCVRFKGERVPIECGDCEDYEAKAGEKQKTKTQYTKEVSWDEFKDNGLLWFTNTILHAFGYAIVLEMRHDKAVGAFPARTRYRGFPEPVNTKGYIKLSKYLKDNIDDIVKEAADET